MEIEEENSLSVLWKICVQSLNDRKLGGKKDYADRLILEFRDLKKWTIFLREDKAGQLLQARVLREHNSTNPCNSLVLWLSGLASECDISRPFITKTEGKSDFPDIDTDVEPSLRPKIKKFLSDKFGQERFFIVGTVGSYKTRSVIQDVARASGLSVQEATEITKNLPMEIEGEDEEDHSIEKMSFDEIMLKVPELNKYFSEHEDLRFHCEALRGQARQVGSHAGGVVVSDRPIDGFIPVFKDKDGSIVSCWSEAGSIQELSYLGLAKIDILGSANLTIISDCIDFVKQTRGITIKKEDIPINDRESITLGTKDLVGIFQLESPYTKKIADLMGIDSISSISALTSLIRPGPKNVGLDVEYASRKKGKPYEKTPLVDEILKDSFGIIVYQEAISAIAQRISGFTALEGNALRKVCSKKQGHLIEKYRVKFIEGAQEKVVSKGILTEKQVADLFNTIESMASYAFNKCLAKNTPVETQEGMVYIDMLRIGDFVSIPDQEEWSKVLEVINNGVRTMFKYKIGKREIICTPDHKLRVNGVGMVPVSDCIKNGYRVKTIDGGFTVEQVKGFSITEESYDIRIDHPTHCYYANGIAVSNSHAFCYSSLTTTEIFLKYKYFTEYMCALLKNTDASAVKRGVKVFEGYIKYCASKGVSILIPDINLSQEHMTPTVNSSIRFGLSAIRNVSNASGAIVQHRPYESLKDFSGRCKSTNEDGKQRKINKRVIESLVFAGAFDSLHGGREGAWKAWCDLEGAQADLFGEVVLPDFIAKQDEMLGCKIPEDLYAKHSPVVKEYGCVSFNYARTSEQEVRLCIFGRLAKVKDTVTKNGKKCLVVSVSSGMDDYQFRVFDNSIDQFQCRYEIDDISIFPLRNMEADCEDKTFRFYDSRPTINWKIRKGEVLTS